MGLPSNIDTATLRAIVATLLGQNANELEGSLIELKRRFSGIPWNFVLGQAAVSGQGGQVDVGGFPIAVGSGPGSNVSTLVAGDGSGRIKVVPRLADWGVENRPGAAAQPTISQAAGATTRHVCTQVTATMALSGAGGPDLRTVVIRDGATGVGTILWSALISVSAVVGEKDTISVSFPAGLKGSVNTAMTAEFINATGANVQGQVAMSGFDLGAND